METKHTAGNLLSKVYIKQATCHCIEFHLKTDHWTSSISTQQNTLIWLGWAAPKNSMNLQWNLCFWNALKQEVIPSYCRQVTEVLWLYFHLTLCLLDSWKFKISLVKFIGCGFRTNTNILNHENSCSTARHSFSFKNRICISIETPEKSKWQRFTKKWIVSFEKASFRDSGGFRGGVPTQLQVYIRHCESGYRWRRWPLKLVTIKCHILSLPLSWRCWVYLFG